VTTLEVGKILVIAAAFDQRTIGELDVEAWEEIIGEMPFDLARERVIGWYSRHAERIMPVNVLRISEEDAEVGFWER
jgi:hypothetical protein